MSSYGIKASNRASTPVLPKQSSKGTHIESHRHSVILNAGPYAPEVSHKVFFDKIIPRTDLTPDQVTDICKRVLDDPAVYSRARQRWTAFPDDPNKAPAKTKEDVIFAGLIPLSQAIAAAARSCVPELEPRTSFHSRPANPPEASTWANLTRPDGEFVRIADRARPEGRTHWMDIAVTGEYKKSGNSAKAMNDDIRKALYNMHHTIREDARRRFTFAFTIENRHTRIWFASRSEVLVSRHFDFMRQPELFIRMFLAFTYASHEDLGWDDSMVLHWDGDTPQYDITVHPFPVTAAEDGSTVKLEPRTFRTKELLSGVGAEHLRGRGTRVWAVNELIDGKVGDESYALKDTWIDSDRMREGYVTAEILQSVTDKNDKEIIESSLLGVEIHGDVFVNGEVDRTLDGDFRGQLLNKHKPRFNFRQQTPKKVATPSKPESTEAPTDTNSSTTNATTKINTKATVIPVGDHRDAVATEKPIQPIFYHSKTHYRIVFKELCQPLYKVTRLDVILWMLLRASAALAIIHKLGWVHRDISSGNLLLNEKDNKVKIADWEYAKKMAAPGTVHDIRTGTEDFMAVEVSLQAYMFLPDRQGGAVRPKVKAGDVERLPQNLNTPVVPSRAAPAPQQQDRVIWSYNPLHDMESIFWICVFYIAYRDIHCDTIGVALSSYPEGILAGESNEAREGRARANYAFGRNLFAARGARMAVLTSTMFREHLTDYPMHPLVAPLGNLILILRQELVKKYINAERRPKSITHRCADGLHDIFVDALYTAFVHVRGSGCGMKVRSLQTEVELLDRRKNGSSSSKRTHSDADIDEDDSESHVSKASRTQLEQSPRGSPQPIKSTVTPTRVLRSHTRKLVKVEPVPLPPVLHSSPPPSSRTRRTNTHLRRRRVATNSKRTVKATAEAVPDAKAKPRKGR